MKKLSILSILCLALLFMPKAFGWDLAWINAGQVLDEFGAPIAPGGLVQLIGVGPNLVVDDPYAWWMSQADPVAAMQGWLAAGCPPVGDDFLVNAPGNPTTILSTDPGYFGVYYISGIASYRPDVQGLYTRFFDAENPLECNWYGTVGNEVAGAAFEPYHFDNDTFPWYIVGIDGNPIPVKQHIEAGPIIPEPASISMVLGGIGLLLAFKPRGTTRSTAPASVRYGRHLRTNRSRNGPAGHREVVQR
jgi:hypothetical protein